VLSITIDQGFVHAHYSANGELVADIHGHEVKWASEGRDKQLFVKETLLTDDNCEAVLRVRILSKSTHQETHR